MKKIIFLSGFVFCLLAVSCHKSPHQEAPSCCTKTSTAVNEKTSFQGQSIYQAAGKWTNQYGKAMELNHLKGKWQISAMIFTSCGYACPRIVENMKAIEQLLPADVKNKVNFLLVSFDTQKDSPDRLQWYAQQHQLDNHWTLLHGNENQVRVFSMLLDVKYEALPNGLFNHSNVITLLDEDGSVRKRIEGLDIDVDETARAIAALVKN